MLHNLFVIKKLENGDKDATSSKSDSKTTEDFIDDNWKLLKSKTNRTEFTLDELNNPLVTIKKYNESLNKEKYKKQ